MTSKSHQVLISPLRWVYLSNPQLSNVNLVTSGYLAFWKISLGDLIPATYCKGISSNGTKRNFFKMTCSLHLQKNQPNILIGWSSRKGWFWVREPRNSSQNWLLQSRWVIVMKWWFHLEGSLLKVSAVKSDTEPQWHWSPQVNQVSNNTPRLTAAFKNAENSAEPPVTTICFLQICTVDKSERARSTGGRIRMNKDLELGFRTYAVFFHSYQCSPGQLLAVLAVFLQLKSTTSRLLCACGVMAVFTASRLKQVQGLNRPVANSGFLGVERRPTFQRRSSFFPRRPFFFLSPTLRFQSTQLPYGGADSSPAGWSRVVCESAHIQLVRRSQPKSSGPNCHFVQTPAQLSAADPPLHFAENSRAQTRRWQRVGGEGEWDSRP